MLKLHSFLRRHDRVTLLARKYSKIMIWCLPPLFVIVVIYIGGFSTLFGAITRNQWKFLLYSILAVGVTWLAALICKWEFKRIQNNLQKLSNTIKMIPKPYQLGDAGHIRQLRNTRSRAYIKAKQFGKASFILIKISYLIMFASGAVILLM